MKSKLGKIMFNRNKKAVDIAAALNITPAAVSKQKKTGIKTLTTAKKYARVLGVEPFFLLD